MQAVSLGRSRSKPTTGSGAPSCASRRAQLLARRLAEQSLTSDEVLAQLASVATASMEDFVTSGR